jgi:3-oxoacyl-[acyl-carrier protein] reductase
MGLLEGKKAIITGGSRGIGRAICEIFAREGADIAFNYNVSDERAAATVDKIQSYGRQALSFKVSVTDRPGVNKMVREINEKFGRIDILVNNAAINRGDMFATTTEKAWDEVIDTNVNGIFNITKPVYKYMIRQRAGTILNWRHSFVADGGALRYVKGGGHRFYQMFVARSGFVWRDCECNCGRNF